MSSDSINPIPMLTQHKLKHFLTIDGLNAAQISHILDVAESFVEVNDKSIKKVPLLRGKTVANLFFETSTRTRSTFELAAKRLSADVLNVNIALSATRKGESLIDTLHTLQAMQCDMFVVRHAQSGAAHFIASHVADHISVINAGDGRHAHPTQALLDMLTIRQHSDKSFAQLKVAIIGDVMHSRVARSDILALKALGVPKVRIIAPKTLIPAQLKTYGVEVFTKLEQGLRDVDVAIMLRLQKERMLGAMLPSEEEYFREYGLNPAHIELMARPALVMHPGPINRGVEVDSRVADGPHSLILDQVSNGIAVRMAVMALVSGPEQ